MNILVFPGGTEIGLELHKSLSQCKEIILFSVGQENSNHAPFVYQRHFTIPSIYQDGWLDELNQIVLQNQIDYIFPAYDDIIVSLAENQDKILAKIVTSPLQTCLITRSKLLTYRHYQQYLPVPTYYETIDEIDRYPVYLKPNRGQSARNNHIIYNLDQLQSLLTNNPTEFIITEYLPGDEFTVDCFCDRKLGLLYCNARPRIRTRDGISMSCHLLKEGDILFRDYAQIIAEKLQFHGAWFFQVKADFQGQYKLLEIAPRVPGTVALQRARGINLPLLSIYEAQGIPLEVMVNTTLIKLDRALVNRYQHNLKFEKIYVDLDDTLIIHGKINTLLIKFLYQCINQEKKLFLITKHSGNLNDTLFQYRLQSLFDEIIHISKQEQKINYINPHGAIFIDDSFSERQSVYNKFKIPTFDCSMIELLIDDRE